MDEDFFRPANPLHGQVCAATQLVQVSQAGRLQTIGACSSRVGSTEAGNSVCQIAVVSGATPSMCIQGCPRHEEAAL